MRVSCAFVLEKSAAFCDHALSQAETMIIAEHLESCEECAHVYAQQDRLEISAPNLSDDVVDLLHDPRYWDDMDGTLNSLIEETSFSANTKRSTIDRTHIFLIALVVLCVGWGFYQQSRVSALSVVVDSQQNELKRLHEMYLQTPLEPPNPYLSPGTSQQVRYDL